MYQTASNPVGHALAPAHLAVVPVSYTGTESPIRGWPAAIKRFLDIVIALLGLILFSIPILLIALAIALETPGPVLFRQQRIGFGNVGFEIWKFRTMHHRSPDGAALVQATRYDPRVTWLGRILRRTSFDELPQLFNVLRGDMSIVGPRPHATGSCAGGKPFELVTSRYFARHRVRPGMTGLAQVRGCRGETETEEKLLQRVEADLEYIENWSLWLDFTILVRTVPSLFAMRNAY